MRRGASAFLRTDKVGRAAGEEALLTGSRWPAPGDWRNDTRSCIVVPRSPSGGVPHRVFGWQEHQVINVELVPEDPCVSPRANVILFFPRFKGPVHPVWLPLEIMTVGTALWKAGYRVRVLDERVEPSAEEVLLREAGDALFVGLSARPGDQVRRSLQLFAKLKCRYPDVVTVFGGWFPSRFPEACLDLDGVDIVVQGTGDVAAVELAERLRNGQDLKGLLGVNARIQGNKILNARRPLEPIDDTPRVPFERFPIERYVTADRCMSYYSSRGCPAACRFCCVPTPYPNEWTGYSAGRVLDEMELLTGRFGAKIFKILDTNFFADRERVRAICRGLTERALDVHWIADARVADIIRFDDELWELVKRSGCHEIVTGREAGCDFQLGRVAKECTSEEIRRAAELVVSHGMHIRVNFIIGLHGEGRRELLGTLRLLRRLQALGPQVRLQFYRYTPIPATSLGRKTWQLVTRGHDGTVPRDPHSIMAIPLNYDDGKLFWLSKREERRVKHLYYFYLPLVYYFPFVRDQARRGPRRWVLNRLVDVGRLRVRYGATAFPLELWLCRKFGRRMPVTREFEWQQYLY
ncbi:MAG: radical SAM protein [Planctomycetota bacterium]